jgi:hypothetical protein
MGLTVIVFAFAEKSMLYSNKTDNVGSTIKDQSQGLVLLSSAWVKEDNGCTYIEGKVKNNNDYSVSGIGLGFNLYDKNGQFLAEATGVMDGLPSGGIGSFKVGIDLFATPENVATYRLSELFSLDQ